MMTMHVYPWSVVEMIERSGDAAVEEDGRENKMWGGVRTWNLGAGLL